ncbi:MAG: PCP reductase family protein [Nitrospirae bacterium]|nr:PCP reductase family protein [Nitrospirota bacterium]MDA1304571.1 PCP reductase family protein [Nitrospirota bacterium]
MSTSESTSNASTPTWTPDALQRIERAPIFLRGMVKRLAEKKAGELGVEVITGELLDQFKAQMMGGMGGEAGMAEAADQMAKGRLPWTAEAKKRLETVPEFMRAMTQQIAEEVAREGGHMEVNVDLFEKVESMGEQTGEALTPLEWTEGAQEMLRDKIKDSPPIALEFVTDMLKHDAEDLARESGLTVIDEHTLTKIWESPQEQVSWNDEAWKRLNTSPDFVRSGIRKAAERRARKLGLKEIDSDHLTVFRNEAMMKAVKRIRAFGYQELTFDAFDDAIHKVKRLKGNDQAEQRLSEIKEFMTKEKPAVGVLGEELMGRFRKYLKGEGKL